jgi:hypothetical protein
MPIYWRRPLTPLEIGLYAALVGVLLAIFLDRLLVYMELAERIAMEVTVINVNSALNVQLASAMLQGQWIDPRKALQRNPFELARMRVPNVHPDIANIASAADLERGYWVFDRSGRELIYLPQLHRGLQTEGPETFVRFRLVGGANTAFVLVPATKYSWK